MRIAIPRACSRIAAALLAASLPAAWIAWPRAHADAAPDALVDEARFLEHCLEQTERARAIYEEAIHTGAKGRALGEASFGRARALWLAGRRGPAEAALEELAALRRDEALRPWPQRAERALAQLFAGTDPFARPLQAPGELTLHAARKPAIEALLELRREARAGLVLDPSLPDPWTVSVHLGPLSFHKMCEAICGRGYVRALGDECFAVGDVASDGAAFERAFRYEELTEPADRRLASILRTRRANLAMPTIDLLEAAKLLRSVTGAEVELRPGALVKPHRVRLWVEELPLDKALDMVAHPLGLVWRIRGGKIVIDRRIRRDD